MNGEVKRASHEHTEHEEVDVILVLIQHVLSSFRPSLGVYQLQHIARRFSATFLHTASTYWASLCKRVRSPILAGAIVLAVLSAFALASSIFAVFIFGAFSVITLWGAFLCFLFSCVLVCGATCLGGLCVIMFLAIPIVLFFAFSSIIPIAICCFSFGGLSILRSYGKCI